MRTVDLKSLKKKYYTRTALDFLKVQIRHTDSW